jgi:hypothetical protein
MALQASLMHSINGVSLGASALIAGARLRGTTCFAGRATEAVLGDRLGGGIIWFAVGSTETVFGSFEHPATARSSVAARNNRCTLCFSCEINLLWMSVEISYSFTNHPPQAVKKCN